jgi:hypothetical protein
MCILLSEKDSDVMPIPMSSVAALPACVVQPHAYSPIFKANAFRFFFLFFFRFTVSL